MHNLSHYLARYWNSLPLQVGHPNALTSELDKGYHRSWRIMTIYNHSIILSHGLLQEAFLQCIDNLLPDSSRMASYMCV